MQFFRYDNASEFGRPGDIRFQLFEALVGGVPHLYEIVVLQIQSPYNRRLQVSTIESHVFELGKIFRHLE